MFHLEKSRDGLTWTRTFSAHHPFEVNKRLYEGPRWRWERVWADHMDDALTVWFDGRSINEHLRAAERML